ncbi:MAG: NAD(P)H-dependent oxidoreductase [Hydrogeniiclostridium mannosilyticum]
MYPVLEEAEMIVLASPIYYHSFTGQLQCAINRIYALDKPKNLKKAALIMSSVLTMYTAERFTSTRIPF